MTPMEQKILTNQWAIMAALADLLPQERTKTRSDLIVECATTVRMIQRDGNPKTRSPWPTRG